VTRPLTVIALALFLLGLEVATGVVSLAGARLWAGSRAVAGGDEFIVSPARYVSGVAMCAAAVAFYGGLLWVGWMQRQLAGGDLCPNCGAQTRRVRRRAWQRALFRTLDAEVTRRHCGRCGWSGLAT
jgi:hypothetical protein